MRHLDIIASTVPGGVDPSVAIAASRAGATGVLNLEFTSDLEAARGALARLARLGRGRLGVKLGTAGLQAARRLAEELPDAVELVMIGVGEPDETRAVAETLRGRPRRILAECTSVEQAMLAAELSVDGLVAKGHEAAGHVGDETTLILVQRFLAEFRLPVWAYGGVGPHSAAGCYVAGCAGVVLDWQLALARESKLPTKLRVALERFESQETTCVGAELLSPCRVYKRPGVAAVDELEALEQELLDQPAETSRRRWRDAVAARAGLTDSSLWLMGQDASFAGPLAGLGRGVAGILTHVEESVRDHVVAARRLRPLDRGAPLAQSHGTEFPILQGPMTRVSDTAEFAEAVAAGGALPFLALALLKKAQVRALMEATRARLGDRPWGVGILGFVPIELRQEQLEVIDELRPSFALIAGGRPDQAARLEQHGIATYLHVPAPGLLRMFLEDGARRFIFEGRECGGHVGPRTSFVLWESMIDALLEAIDRGVPAEELHAVFAGGIHDARSAATVAAMAAPLAERGARIGVLIGTGYLFTEEAVRTGAIVEGFQQEALRCTRTVLLETGPGHSIRCAETPFFETFRQTKRKLLAGGASPDDVRMELEKLNLGRLRLASKGTVHESQAADAAGRPRYVPAGPDQQRLDGMYMIGQVAVLRDRVCRVADLHEDVSVGSSKVLDACPVPEVSRAASPVASRPSDVAVVGMGCLLPGAQDVATFWANVLNGVDAIREIPRDRFDYTLYYDPDRKVRDKIYSKWGGFIDDVPFDPMRYGIPPSALASIDPLQLLALVAVDQALQHAGYATRDFPRERTSVILGLSGGLGDLGCDYSVRANLPTLVADVPSELLDRLPEWTEDSFAGLLPNVAAGRIANRFDLGGVNFTVDAACASSLSALAVATRELQVGSSDMVIVGGVDTVQSPFGYLCFSKAQALSPRGRCSTFDESADGIVISEGVVMFVLKRLEDARRDGDRVYAVIKAVAGSSDGRGKGLMAPRVAGQIRALERAYAQAGVSPATVGLIEAHGTGTVAGDAAEVETLTQVFRTAGSAPASCALGSVKSMIGHTKSTAGVAGLLKAVLALHHKILPPTLHVKTPNGQLREPGSPFFVNTEPRPWIQPADGSPRRAGVSSFGFGGTNFHAVVEEDTADAVDARDLPGSDQWPAELFVWTAPSPERVADQVATLETRLAGADPVALRDLAAAVWRAGFSATAPTSVRLAIVASDVDDLRAKIREAADALRSGRVELQEPRGIYLGRTGRAGKLACLFPGQGSQYPHMVRDLAMHFAEVRESLEAADLELAGRLPRRLSSYVFPLPAFSAEETAAHMQALTDTVVAQPALGAVEIGLFRLLANLGVKPDLVAGHSYGEYVALCAAGVFGERALFAVSEARGRAIKDSVADAPGAMAAVSATGEAVAEALDGTPGVWLANFNAPQQTVIAGRREDLEAAIRTLEARGLSTRALPVACAFHTPLMQAARERLAAALSALPCATPRAEVFSNSSGQPYPAEPAAVRTLLAEHLGQPVRFVDEIRSMYDAGARIFLEVGPRNVLAGLTRQILAGRDASVLALDAADRDGVTQLLHTLALLAVHGVAIELDRLFQSRAVRALDLDALLPKTAKRAPGWVVTGRRTRSRAERREPLPPVRLTVSPASAQSAVAGLSPVDHAGRPTLVPQKAMHLSEGLPVNRPLTTYEPAGGPAVEQEHEHTPSRTAVGGTSAQAPTTAPTLASESSAPLDAQTAILLQFQNLMGQFLQTQDAVMGAYFQTLGHHDGIRTHVAPSALPVVLPAPRPANPAPLPRVVAPGRVPLVAVGPQAAESTPPARAPQPLVAAPRREASAAERPDHVSRLLEIVAERTGYPQDMLDLDSNIEADLGIDSIKRVEILSTFQRQSSADERSRLQAAMEKISSLKTLRETADALTEVLSSAGEEAVAS